ncbi:MAG: tetratricopeptide repeat protein [Pyrinomonadaceae bacterium]|nr:tetratricopeptide repeat protein [Pyrinomonadaceae bacterium]MCX7638936.1 tetratricopeptide repeat protein [Pyrinomonadaceae bacterium]MDW8304927.1 tetratricopeptide repeat protein [Acidobacteriota bacterium]
MLIKVKTIRKSFTIFLALILLACNSKQEYLSLGEDYIKRRKFPQAIMAFRTAADIDPSSYEAFYGLAKAYQAVGQISEAIASLEKAVRLAPENLELKIHLGTLYLLAKPPQFSKVNDLLNELFATRDDYIEAYLLKANFLSLQGASEDEVLATFGKALQLDENYLKTHLAIARYYEQKGKLQQAKEWFEKATSVNKASALACLEYGRFLHHTGRNEQAEEMLKKAIGLDPLFYEAHLALANFYFSHGDMVKAEQAYKQLAETLGNSAEGISELANFYKQTGNTEMAITALEQALEKEPESVIARYQLADIYLSLNEPEKAKQQTEALLSFDRKDVQALVLYARALSQEGDYEKSKETLEEALRIQPTSKSALFYMIQTLISLSDAERARMFVADLEKYYPEYLYSKLLKAQIENLDGNAEKALQETSSLLQLLSNSLENKEIKKKTLSFRAKVLLEQGKIAEAEKELKESARITPNSPSDFIDLANVYALKRNFNEAISLYTKALEMEKDSLEAITGIINILKSQRKFSEAYQKLDLFSQKLENINLLSATYCLKAQVSSAEGRFADAEQTLEKAIKLNENYLPAYVAYADLMISQGRKSEAIVKYLKIAEKRPSSSIYTLIAMLEEANQNWKEAESFYRKALELNKENSVALNNLAWLIATQTNGNLDEALALAQMAINKNRKEAAFYDTLGWIYFKKGLLSQAIENFRRAILLDDQTPSYRLRLAKTLIKLGEKPSAKKELEMTLKLENRLSRQEAEEARNLLRSL